MPVESPYRAGEAGARLVFFSAITALSISVLSAFVNLALAEHGPPLVHTIAGGLFSLAGIGAALLAAFGFGRLATLPAPAADGRGRIAFALLLAAAAVSLLLSVVRYTGLLPFGGAYRAVILLRVALDATGWYLGGFAVLASLRALGVRPGGGLIALVALALAWSWVDPVASMLVPGAYAFGGWKAQVLLTSAIDVAASVILLVAFHFAAQAYAERRAP